MRNFFRKILGSMSYARVAFKSPDICFSENNLKMITALYEFIMKVAVEKRPYATKIALITPDNESHGIVSLWAGSGASADPIDRMQELVKENQALKKDIIRLEKEKTGEQ